MIWIFKHQVMAFSPISNSEKSRLWPSNLKIFKLAVPLELIFCMLNPYVIMLLCTQFELGLTLFTLSSSPSTLLIIVHSLALSLWTLMSWTLNCILTMYTPSWSCQVFFHHLSTIPGFYQLLPLNNVDFAILYRVLTLATTTQGCQPQQLYAGVKWQIKIWHKMCHFNFFNHFLQGILEKLKESLVIHLKIVFTLKVFQKFI